MKIILVGIAGLAIGLGVGVAASLALLRSQRPGAVVTGTPYDPAAPRFPTTEGSNLNRRAFVVPGGLDARLNVLMVAFVPEQQEDVNSWLPTARDLGVRHANVEYYELPTISRSLAVAGGFVDEGMRAGIPDFDARERTITLYTDLERFLELSGIIDRERIWVGLVDREGVVYWSVRGPATPEGIAALREKVAAVASPEAAGLE